MAPHPSDGHQSHSSQTSDAPNNPSVLTPTPESPSTPPDAAANSPDSATPITLPPPGDATVDAPSAVEKTKEETGGGASDEKGIATRGLGDMSAEEWKKQGNIAFQAHDYDNASVYYSNGIELEPTNPALFSNRSAAYLKLGDHAKARRDADMCIQLDKHWAKGWWRRGQAQLEAQEYVAARETFREGLTFCENDDNLVRGLEGAEKRIAVVEAVQGSSAPAEFDPNAPSTRKERVDADEGAGGESGNAGGDDPSREAFPGTPDDEIARIQAAPNHYAVLHVSPDATAAQLKKNYHILARVLHPDKCKHPAASEAMGQVSLAYDTLTNVVKKTLYDQFMSQTAEGDKAQSYAEWEAQATTVELPKWLAWLLQIKGCGWFLAILMFLIALPFIAILVVVFLIGWLICCPYRMTLRYCFPERYARMKEEQERERAKMEEAMQDVHV